MHFNAPEAFPRGKEPRHPLVRRLGWPQIRSRRCGQGKMIYYPCREDLKIDLYLSENTLRLHYKDRLDNAI
jgi:hypothetical protein